jgi:putative transcriptional regulator
MIRCHLSTLMDRDKLRVADVARLTGLNRSTITALQNESAARIDLAVMARLCAFFHCGTADLFEYVPNQAEQRP